jgi:hypothetical protein
MHNCEIIGCPIKCNTFNSVKFNGVLTFNNVNIVQTNLCLPRSEEIDFILGPYDK